METSPHEITDIVGQGSEQQRDPATVAIERVLQAERAAEAKLSECQQQAETLVAAAREQAAALAKRVDARISKLHAAYLQKVDRNIAERPSQLSASTGVGPITADSELARAAHRLAAKLAGDT